MNGNEQQEPVILDEGTEEYEEYEEDFESDDDYPQMFIFPIKISAKTRTVEISLDKNQSMHITNISLAADNVSTQRHIVEICQGHELQNKIVISRLIPNVIESQCVDIYIPPQITEQIIVLVLTGQGDLGDVDILAKIEYETDEEFGSQQEDSCCGSDHHHHDPSDDEEDGDDDDVVQTLQRQKEEIQTKKAQNQQVPCERHENPFDVQFNEQKSQNDVQQDTTLKPQWRNVKGVRILDKKIGHGPEAKRGDQLVVKYIGRLNNETGKEFDRSQKNFRFPLGQGTVIQGWDIGICNMKVGGRRWLVIPPHLGYGKQDVPGIPKNSTLFFDVELIDVKK